MDKFCPSCKKIRHTETWSLVRKDIDKRSGYDLNSTNLQGKIITSSVEVCHTCGTLFVPR